MVEAYLTLHVKNLFKTYAVRFSFSRKKNLLLEFHENCIQSAKLSRCNQ